MSSFSHISLQKLSATYLKTCMRYSHSRLYSSMTFSSTSKKILKKPPFFAIRVVLPLKMCSVVDRQQRILITNNRVDCLFILYSSQSQMVLIKIPRMPSYKPKLQLF